MKKAISLFVIILLSGSVFAQSNEAPPAKQKPNPTLDSLLEKMQTMEVSQKRTIKKNPVSVTLKTDTVVYRIDHRADSYYKLDQLIGAMSSFKIVADGTIEHLSNPIEKFKLNGKDYVGMDMIRVLHRLPVSAVESMEIIDDYGDAAKNTFKHPDPYKVLNVNLKPEVADDIDYYLANRPSRPAFPRSRYDDPTLYGDINRINEHNPVDRQINRSIRNMMAGTDRMGEVDMYGDQIPHFLFPLTYPVKYAKPKKDNKADKDKAARVAPLNP